MKITLFKTYLDKIREILSSKTIIEPESTPVDQLLNKIQEDRVVLKSAFDNEILGIDEFITKMTELKREEEELKGREKRYADVIIKNDKGEILLLKRSMNCNFYPGAWSLPGGHIELNETPEIAAIRESIEETNLKI